MGVSRVTKKLVSQLQDIDGAILMLNATDPQLATFMLFEAAVSHLPNFIVINKIDRVTETEAQMLASKFPGRQITLASIKTGRGLDEIKARLEEYNGKCLVLGIFNSGKTSLINNLTGEDNLVGDIPGTTLEFTPHRYKHLTLVDSVGQIIDISKPLMVSIDLSECKTIKEKLYRCLTEDMSGISSSIDIAIPSLEKAIKLIKQQIDKGKKIVVTGAGASALVAKEIAGQGNETGLPIMVFTNEFATAQPVSFAKGFGEDEMALAEYGALAINEGDICIGISASGGTASVHELAILAKKKGAFVIAITENADTPLGHCADIIIKSEAKPEGPSSSKVQIAHLAIAHALILTLADERGIDAQTSIEFMLPSRKPNKRMGIK